MSSSLGGLSGEAWFMLGIGKSGDRVVLLLDIARVLSRGDMGAMLAVC